MEKLFNVVAVDLETGAERVLAENKTERNADAIVTMAVMRRGVENEFFKAVQVVLPPNAVVSGRPQKPEDSPT